MDGESSSDASGDVCVVVVHGIGEQAEGETLTEYGGAIASHLAARADSLSVPCEVSADPLTISVEWTTDRPRRCQIVEAWWAERFEAPSPTRVLLWSAVLAPLMLHRHAFSTHSVRLGTGSVMLGFAQVLEVMFGLVDRVGGWRRLLLGAAAVLVAVLGLRIVTTAGSLSDVAGMISGLAIGLGTLVLIVVILWIVFWWALGYVLLFLGALRLILLTMLAPLVQTMLMLLALLAAIPLPFVRRGARHLTTQLAQSVGDSFAFVEQVDAHDAIVGAVRSTIAEAAATNRSVIVVAHSQGGAVVQRVLTDYEPDNLRWVVTLGSGLGKLDYLRQTTGARVRLLTGAIARTALLVAAAVLAIVSWRQGWELEPTESGEDPTPVVAIIALVLVLALAAWGAFVHLRAKRVLTDAVESIVPRHRRWTWLDLASRADLVTDGPLPLEPPHGESIEVANDGSVVTDHVTYHRNSLVLDLITAAIETSIGSPRVLAYSDHDRGALSAGRFQRVSLRRASATFWCVVGAVGGGWVAAVAGVSEVLGAVAGALVVSPFASRPWRRWHRRANELESRGATVAAFEGVAVLNPFRWVRLPASPLSGLEPDASFRRMRASYHEQRARERAKRERALQKAAGRRAWLRRVFGAPFRWLRPRRRSPDST